MSKDSQADILIVDDQLDNLKVIQAAFERHQPTYRVSLAPSGEIALKLMARKVPDLVITDWEMPQMNGIELVRHIQEKPNMAHIPIIMCTGIMTSSENLQTALEAGAFDYLRKPVDAVELIARTNAALAMGRGRKEILSQNQQLKEHIATKDRFFSIIAHDLKSPFNAVLGVGQMLREDLHNQEFDNAAEEFDLIYEAAEQGFKLLENLLDWARVQTNAIRFSPSEFDLQELIRESMSLFGQPAKNKNIALFSDSSQPLTIMADRNMIFLVLRNLVSNAIKFTHPGGEVRVSAVCEARTLTISVADNGVGMSDDQIKKLFDITHNSSTFGTQNERGTGLGLILSLEFINMHNGSIEISSKPQQGSTFCIHLPQSDQSS